MNAARVDRSERLRRVLRLLKRVKEASTRDIIERAGVCAVNSIAAELRANGYPVRCERMQEQWYYSLPRIKA